MGREEGRLPATVTPSRADVTPAEAARTARRRVGKAVEDGAVAKAHRTTEGPNQRRGARSQPHRTVDSSDFPVAPVAEGALSGSGVVVEEVEVGDLR